MRIEQVAEARRQIRQGIELPGAFGVTLGMLEGVALDQRADVSDLRFVQFDNVGTRFPDAFG